MNIVKVKDVFFSYDDKKKVLSGLNIEVSSGEIVGLLGANGSGKTTTFKLLSGLINPDEGTIEIDGVSIGEDLKGALKKCAFVPDESLLYPGFSAEENMNLFSILWGVDPIVAKESTKKLLEEVGLWQIKNQWVKSFSRGMKQKLSLCTALIHEPKILLMDEPFTGLDIDALVWAKEMLKVYVQKNDRSIIFTSHIPEIIESLATRVLILKNGQIIHEEIVKDSKISLIETYKNLNANS
jgi:ABC-2 type transport system ATP-binding protein